MVIGTCMARHRHEEWLKFLRLIDKNIDKELDIHLIADNYATHKHPEVKAWLKKHPRFHMHFTPTSSSWLNLIECWFRDITTKRIRRGSFPSVNNLINAIEDYIAINNESPTPFTWTKTANVIIEKVKRGRVALEQARII